MSIEQRSRKLTTTPPARPLRAPDWTVDKHGARHRPQPLVTYRIAPLLVATRDFETDYDGQRQQIRAGRDHIRADHPIVSANPDAFAPRRTP